MRKSFRRSRAFVARLEGLEARQLLTLSIGQVGQGPYDFVTSTQNPGADGIEDVQIVLNNLILGDEISSADVVGTLTNNATPLQWVSGSNPDGYLDAEVARVTHVSNANFPYTQDNTISTADLYISAPPAGDTLSNLTISLTYSDGTTQSASYSNSQVFASFSPTAKVPGEAVSSSLIPTEAGAATFVTQYPTAGTSPTHNAGDAFVTLASLPNGDTLSNLEDVYLSDGTASNSANDDNASDIANNQPVGDETWSWASSGGTAGPEDLPIGVQNGSSGAIDLTFRPIRNESGATMTLRYVVKDSSGTHSDYTQFTGGVTDVTEVGTTWNHNAQVVDVSPAVNTSGQLIPNEVTFLNPTTKTSTTDTLADILDATSGVYATGAFDRIYLEPGTYSVNYSSTTSNPALTIARPVQLDGSPSAILSFTANSIPPGPTQAETDYGDAIDISSNHVTLSNFQIRFPDQVYFSSGMAIGAGPPSSVNLNTSRLVDVNFQNLNIQGPAPAEHFSNGYASPDSFGNDGVQSQSLIDCWGASGTIENCTLRGGTIEFDAGPWAVIGNTYLGTVPTDLTYSSSYPVSGSPNQVVPSNTPEIFASSSPHDQVIEDNTVSETRPSGTSANSPLGFAYRFLYDNGGSGYNNLIQGNSAGNGVGLRVGSDTSPSATNPTPYVQGEVYHNLVNAPEFVLNEEYVVDYEGITLSVGSSTSSVLSIPPPSVTFYRQPVQAGDVVAILNGPNVGQYDPITQVLDSSDFLMENPLPSGSYQISICQGLVGSRYVGNDWNLTNTTSVGFEIQGSQFGVQITGNTIVGDDTSVIDGKQNDHVNSGIDLESTYINNLGNSSAVGYVDPDPVPTEYWTHDVIFGAVVDDNTIDGTGKGITAETLLGGSSDLGLTFLSATITNNRFEGDQAIANPNSTAIPDFSSVLTIGDDTQNSPTSASGPRRTTLGFAVLNASGNAIANPSSTTGSYVPNTPTDPNAQYNTDFAEFSDPDAVRVTLAGNWDQPDGATVDMTIVSGVVNGTATVYNPQATVSPLPTTPLFEAAVGGTASDSAGSNDSSGEGATQAFDGKIASKWLTFASSGVIAYQFPGNAAYAVTEYALTAGSDTTSYPDRAPKNWMFQGSNDGLTWVTLDTETNQADTVGGDTRVYSIANTTEFRDYRLDVTSNNYETSSDNNGNGIIQLAELQLFAQQTSPNLTNVSTESTGSPSDSGNDVNGQGPSNAFDGNNRSTWLVSGSSNAWLEYTFANGTAEVVTQYTMVAGPDISTYPDRAPKSWEFEGWNGSTWVTLDTEIDQPDTVNGDARTFTIANETADPAYRLLVLANNDDIAGDNNGNGLIELAELKLLAVVPTSSSTQRTSVATLAVGGTATDSHGSNDSNGEGAAQAFDGNIASKWLTFASSGDIEYEFPSGETFAVTQYAITSGSDTATYPDRAPSTWTLEGSFNGTSWTTLDTETDQPDPIGGDTRVYSITNTTAYPYYELNITSNHYDTTSDNNGNGIIQLAELQLFAIPTASSPMIRVATASNVQSAAVMTRISSDQTPPPQSSPLPLVPGTTVSAGSGRSLWPDSGPRPSLAVPLLPAVNPSHFLGIKPFRSWRFRVVPVGDGDDQISKP